MFTIYLANTISGKVITGAIILIISIVGFLKAFNENTIEIKADGIELIKPYTFKDIKPKHFNFSEILSLKYNCGGYKQESAIYLKTDLKSNIKVLIPDTSFEFGFVLRFLKEKGISINLVHSDHELRMYIDGQIKDFPMTNNTEIKTKKESDLKI
ncbi:hypothetical protein [Formosa sp. L2A11]|uniref:hypothetical protein n=1 Tax=Formosa sp. L2A11 TaxID=2686363 RepID=UPI00131E2B5A|nr:hypothetical protein [Formosa sp. L2A11]